MVQKQEDGDREGTKFTYRNFAYLCSDLFLIEVQIIKHIRNVRHE